MEAPLHVAIQETQEEEVVLGVGVGIVSSTSPGQKTSDIWSSSRWVVGGT